MLGPFLLTNSAFHHARRAVLHIAALLSAPVVFAQAPFEIRATVDGRERDFEASENEVLVVRRGDRPANELRDLLTSGLEGAIVTEHTGTHALVRLPRAFDHVKAADRKDAISTLLPDAEIRPVLYPKGLPHTESTRHVATRDLLVKLPAGKTAAQVVADAGATGSETTIVADYVVVHFASPYRALDGARKLRAGGMEVRPQLARAQSKRALPPTDQFFSEQWHLFNIGQGGGLPGVDAKVLGAWDVTLGNGINIAVVDDGLQTNHPDLRENCPDIASNLHHDFIDVDNDPRPTQFDNHGTAVAGVAAARQNNGTINPSDGSLLGVSGSAPEAKLVGLRLIAGPFTDLDSATALYWKPSNFVIGVSNNSWGPFDGSGLHGPDVLTKAALEKATAEGRGGNGQITVFASGNGNQICCGSDPVLGFTVYPDNSNLDGYANSRFVLAVGAVDNTGRQSFYSEPGANIMVVAPSNGGTLGIVTTDQTGVNGYNPLGPGNLPNTDYTNDFGGTSSAAPLTAGGVALMLASSSDSLGWRDVKEILAGTARQIDQGDPDWMVNGGGFKFNHKYGGGMIDLRAAVIRARTWANLGTEISQTVTIPAKNLPINIPDGPMGSVTQTFNFTGQPNLRLEQIEIILDISHQHRSDLTISITSPSGFQSFLTRQHSRPLLAFTGDDDVDFKDSGGGWTFTTTHHWGDNSIFKDPATGNNNGIWTLTIRDQASGTLGKLNAATVRLLGTIAPQSRVVFEQSVAYSLSESQIEDPANPGQFINAKQRVRLKRLGPLDGEATVDYSTTLGTATPPNNPGGLPADFTPVSGTAHFSNGQQFADQDILVELLPDAEPEPTEQVNLVLNNPVGATLGGVTLATIDILDSSQNFVTVAATDNTASETNFDIPVDWGTFTISRQTAAPSPLTVHFNITGTATYDDGITAEPDYLNIPLVATIPAFEKSVEATVAPINDSTLEGVETVILNLEADPAYALGDAASAEIDIVDNDLQKIQIEALDNQGKENDANNTCLIQISRSVDFSAPNAFDDPLSVDVSLGGTQRPSKNYLVKVDGVPLPLGDETQFVPLEIPAGMTSIDVLIVPVNDNVYEATKTVVVGLRPNPNYESSFGFLTNALVRIVEDDPVPDTVIPTVRIDAPLEGAKIFKGQKSTIPASGVAKDNISVQRVLVTINGNSHVLVPDPLDPQKFSWSIPDITSDLVLGPNVMTVQARDGDMNNFNESAVKTVHFTFIEKHNLTVVIDGAGTVTEGFEGTSERKAGASFDIKAKPAPGSVFAGWFSDSPTPDTLISGSRKLHFTMPTNPATDVTIRAKFVPSPYTTEIVGSYAGLVQPPNFTFESSGFISLEITPTGAFTGKLIFGGKKIPLQGEFTVQQQGDAAAFLGVFERGSGLTPVTLNLSLDTNPAGTRRVTGTANSGPVAAEVVADRAVYDKQHPAPQALVSKYTLYMPPASPLGDTFRDPHGISVGTVKINAKGVVKWFGRLSDRTVVEQTAALTKDGTWPLFLKLYNGGGVMLGVVTHAVQTESDLSASLDWFRPPTGSAKFPLGFLIKNHALIGAMYSAPESGFVLPSFPAPPDNMGTITISDGNLLNPITAQFLLKENNKVKFDAAANPSQIEIKIDTTNGTFFGSFVHTISQKVTDIEGIVFQKTGHEQMLGSFLGKSQPGVPRQSGRVIMEANPPPPAAP